MSAKRLVRFVRLGVALAVMTTYFNVAAADTGKPVLTERPAS